MYIAQLEKELTRVTTFNSELLRIILRINDLLYHLAKDSTLSEEKKQEIHSKFLAFSQEVHKVCDADDIARVRKEDVQ